MIEIRALVISKDITKNSIFWDNVMQSVESHSSVLEEHVTSILRVEE
jgi:hypothetical protein